MSDERTRVSFERHETWLYGHVAQYLQQNGCYWAVVECESNRRVYIVPVGDLRLVVPGNNDIETVTTVTDDDARD